jgi:hypothetical protein
MHTLSTQLQMNKLNTQIQPSSNLHPAQFTYQPVSMGGGSLNNTVNLDKKKNILDMLMKKLSSTKSLQTIK